MLFEICLLLPPQPPKNLISHLSSEQSGFSERPPRIGHKLARALRGIYFRTEHTQRL